MGCGTGGFTRAIAASAGGASDRLRLFGAVHSGAKHLPAPEAGAVDWLVGDAEQLPFERSRFNRLLLSVVLHQLARAPAAVSEAFRVVRTGGLVLVRTIAPEDAAHRVPERYLPAMAAADAARLPPLDVLVDWLRQAGFVDVAVERHLRNKRLALADQERELRTEARFRYTFLTNKEVEEAIERMRADAVEGEWIDPRPTYVIVAAKSSA